MKLFWRFSGLALIGTGLWLLASQEVSWWSGWGSIIFIFGLVLLLSTWWLGGLLALLASPVLLVTGIVRFFFPGGGWWHWILAALAVFIVALSSLVTLSSEDADSDDGQGSSNSVSPDTDDPSGNAGPLPAPSKIRTQLNPSRVIAGLSPTGSKPTAVSYDRDCRNCGGTSRPGRQFCGVCGEPLDIIET